jgi:spore maturation protein CgeB/GT2 family glycosyltransferase
MFASEWEGKRPPGCFAEEKRDFMRLGRAKRPAFSPMINEPTEFSSNKGNALEEEKEKRAKLAALRKGLRVKISEIADLHGTIARQEAALEEKNIQIEELAERSSILKQGLDTIEAYFSELCASRSFRFMVYTARRMGLVSRTPRRCLEAIKNHFPKVRKALKQVKKKALRRSMANPAVAASGKSSDALPQTAPGEFDPGLKEIERARFANAVALRKAACSRNAVCLPSVAPAKDASLCFILLHHGGEQDLQNLFTSFLEVNTHSSVEFSIVLQACVDGSREVITSFQDRLRIKVTEHSATGFVAGARNRAAEQTSADYLIFLASGIIFQEEITGELLRSLQDPQTGLAGVRVLYPPNHPDYPGGVKHAGVKFRDAAPRFFQLPFTLGAPADVVDTPLVPERFPAVSGEVVACRRGDFLAAGGFCEDYLQGYEDVDLSLSFQRLLGLRTISANHISCICDGNPTAADDSNAIEDANARLSDISQFIRRQEWYLRRKISIDKLAGVFFSDEPPTVAFVVTEATPLASAGDYFTASELAEACLKEFGWRIRYLSSQEDWYNLEDVDFLIVLLDYYDLSKIQKAKPSLVKVAWLRNWFERWAARPYFDQYDLFLSSSIKSARWLKEKHRKPAWVFPLATNPDRFAAAVPDPELETDYCFTGNYWEFDREITQAVQPLELDYTFALFGKGWDMHPKMSPYSWGFLPYAEMPKVYASTRIVVDDANHVTKDWGSVNSRVFDALAAGALVITNGDVGAAEIFEGELPAYRSSDELRSLLMRYLGNKAESQALVERLRLRVLSRHTYRHRARTLKHILIARARRAYRIALKIGAPTRQEIQHWGDYHFARSLGRYFAEEGHSFRIDCLDEWDRTESLGDDVVIVLRGLTRYHPKPGQINLMWNISHPDKIEDAEYSEFDHVFVASELHAANLAGRIARPVSALLQCTDPDIFYPDPNAEVPEEKILFVGNSRKQYRDAVRFAVQAELPLGIYGTHWPMFVPPAYIRGEYIENTLLRQHYSRCAILLNDHWPSMRKHGFVSNRIFDAAAAGAFVLSDSVEAIEPLFGNDLVTYRTEAEFQKHVRYYLSHPEERWVRAERLRSRVLGAHTFAHRAKVLMKKITEVDEQKRDPKGLKGNARESGIVAKHPPR